MGNTRRLIRELAHDLAEAKAQAWTNQEEVVILKRLNEELALQITALEAIAVEQEKELLKLTQPF